MNLRDGYAKGTLTESYVLLANGGNLLIKKVTSKSAASKDSTLLINEASLYYSLPLINDSHVYDSDTTIYVPTSKGSYGQVLIANESGLPAWASSSEVAVSNLTKLNTGLLLQTGNKSTSVINDSNINETSLLAVTVLELEDQSTGEVIKIPVYNWYSDFATIKDSKWRIGDSVTSGKFLYALGEGDPEDFSKGVSIEANASWSNLLGNPSDNTALTGYIGGLINDLKTEIEENYSKEDAETHASKVKHDTFEDISVKLFMDLFFTSSASNASKASLVSDKITILSPTKTTNIIGTKVGNINILLEGTILRNSLKFSKEDLNIVPGSITISIYYSGASERTLNFTKSYSVTRDDLSISESSNVINFSKSISLIPSTSGLLPVLYYGDKSIEKSILSINIQTTAVGITFPEIEVTAAGGTFHGYNGNNLSLSTGSSTITLSPTTITLGKGTSMEFSSYIPIYYNLGTQKATVGGTEVENNNSLLEFTESGIYYIFIPTDLKPNKASVETIFGDADLGIIKVSGPHTKVFAENVVSKLYNQYVITNGTTLNPYNVLIESGKKLKITLGKA